jgi:RES domain-containing protein
MASIARHDNVLLDALDISGGAFAGTVWRVTSQGRPPLKGSTSNGRWSGSEDFSVLYTSCEKDGALAEVGFRLSLEPIWPSRLQHDIHSLNVDCANVLDLTDYTFLQRLGVKTESYPSLDYTVTQKIAAAAHFLEFDAILVPSARFACNNLVIFDQRDSHVEVLSSSPVDWVAWRKLKRAV